MDRQKKIKAEAFDVMQYFYGAVHEPLIHCVIRFAEHLDENILKKAVDLSLNAVPLLRCCFRIPGNHPYWEEQDFTSREIVDVVVVDENPEEQEQKLLATKLNFGSGPQLKIYIIREQKNDTLCIIMNHMICDGAGFKQYIYLLCDLYTCCDNQHEIAPMFEARPRNARILLSNFSFIEKLQILFSSNNISTADQQLTFPLQGDPKRPFFVKEPIIKKDFLTLKALAKNWGVTINDMIVAAYMRVLAKKLRIDHIRIPCPVDLRKYLPAECKFGITNLTSNFICDVIITADEAFEKTVLNINEQIKGQKSGNEWLKGIMMLEFFYHCLPFQVFQKLFHHAFTIPVISFTNLGIIDKNLLRFGRLQVKDAYITGAVKYVPYFQLAVSTFDDCCTLSSNLYGTSEDYLTIKDFLIKVKEELLNQSEEP